MGDISAIVQANRMTVCTKLLERPEWHSRLLNGSDYPLPGVVPMISLGALAGSGLRRRRGGADVAHAARSQRAALRLRAQAKLASHGKRFAPAVFETSRWFPGMAAA